MNATEKFLFENIFDQAELYEQPEEEEVIEEPPEPTFSEEELAAARSQGFVEGRAEGIAEMEASRDRRVTDLMEDMLNQLRGLTAVQERAIATTECRMLELATAIARKVMAPVSRDTAEQAVVNVIRDCLPKLRAEPRIVLRVHATLMNEIQPKVDSLAATGSFAGDIILLADDELGPSDCRVEWADGGTERSEEKIWAEIDALTRNYAAAAATAAKPDDAAEPEAVETPIEENPNG